MLRHIQPLVYLVEEKSELREDIITFLSGEGCLMTPYEDLCEVMIALKETMAAPHLLLINESLPSHQWAAFISELEDLDKNKKPVIHTYKEPVDLESLLLEIVGLFKK